MDENNIYTPENTYLNTKTGRLCCRACSKSLGSADTWPFFLRHSQTDCARETLRRERETLQARLYRIEGVLR